VIRQPTYAELHVERWEKRAPNGGGMGGGPDPLWTCGDCGAAIADREKHNDWHLALLGLYRAGNSPA
jgi:hypothetical protein